MSHYDYEVSKSIYMEDLPFYALIMAAMRGADSDNLLSLQLAFPMVWGELNARYNAPGGYLENETPR